MSASLRATVDAASRGGAQAGASAAPEAARPAGESVLSLRGLTIALAGEDARQLVERLDLDIARGEIVGLVGESGSGKSLTARAVVRLLPRGVRATGTIALEGVDVLSLKGRALRQLRGRKVASIFQEPRAHVDPLWRIQDHLQTPMREVQGLSRAQARARALELLESLGIVAPERVMRLRPDELSGGMLQRVLIAGALAAGPSLLLADEPTTALDVTTQAEIAAILADLRRTHGLATLFITHDLDLAAALCDRIVVLYAGRVCEQASTERIFAAPAHPYTAGLLAARPTLDGPLKTIHAIPGQPINGAEAPTGCAFRARCELALERCAYERPALESVGASTVACHRARELSVGA